MDRIYAITPWVLLLAVIGQGAIGLYKGGHDDSGKPRFKKVGIILFTVIALCSLLGLYHEREEKQAAEKKAELSFSFVPFPNPPPPQVGTPVTWTSLPRAPDGSFHVEFSILNRTDVDAVASTVNVLICKGCSIAKESPDLRQLPGMTDEQREIEVPMLHAREATQTMSMDVIDPAPLATGFELAFTFRCHTCKLDPEPQKGIVIIGSKSRNSAAH